MSSIKTRRSRTSPGTGHRYGIPVGGKWTVIGPTVGGYCLCRCTCGVEKLVRANGGSRGCRACVHPSTHGHTMGAVSGGKITDEYRAWASMNARTKPDHRDHERYYDRGVTVCPEWVGDGGYERFLAHVGPRPGKSYSLDRIENDDCYRPGNVRWATKVEQGRNRRDTVMLTIDNVTRCVAEWADLMGMSRPTVYGRLRRGWSPHDALFVPPSTQSKRW